MRLPALSAVCAVVSAPKEAGLLMSVVGGAKFVWFSTLVNVASKRRCILSRMGVAWPIQHDGDRPRNFKAADTRIANPARAQWGRREHGDVENWHSCGSRYWIAIRSGRTTVTSAAEGLVLVWSSLTLIEESGKDPSPAMLLC